MDNISKFINQSLRVLNKNPRMFAPLADAYRRQGLFQKALQVCESGIKRYPNYAQGYAVLGCIYFDLKKYKKAVGHFEKSLDLEPGHLLSLRYLSDLYIRFKDVKKLLCIYEMLLLYNPQDVQIQDIINKIHSAHLDDYDYFSEQSLEVVAKDLSQRELDQKPSIRPLKCHMNMEPSKQELLDQMLTPFPRVSRKKLFPTMKAERERKLQVLRDLMSRIN